ncbi:type 1 glutamine amidotransferase domain-containing protein [Leptospira biflexa]|uniref:type 1 glutamine amidotransferase domain-containing protein n=1 Tax=Leptospira biflexa TaxID=172 RepID=UPI0010916F97|nr:type 1 glutamine amidotransferase domain-containing protein [Leptospira biflexa]TGM56053.1 type 1 glutamine amidotransferase domain-containing protein [Leptospira biflexa]
MDQVNQTKVGTNAESQTKQKLVRTDLGRRGKLKFMILIFGAISIFSNGLLANPKGKARILVVMSAADSIVLDGVTKHPTGVFLNELYFPVKTLSDKGHQIVFATPLGKKSTIDPESVKEKYWKSIAEKEEAIQFLFSLTNFKNPISLEQAIKDDQNFVGILVPGGQGLMTDLLYDEKIPELLRRFHKKQKPIGLVCHAPALLTTLRLDGEKENFIFKGYQVNSVTKMEEWFIETFVMKGKPKVRNISGSLKDLGMEYKSSFLPGRSYAIRDRNLVTSQNPFSGEEFSEMYWKAVEDYLQMNPSLID